MLSNIAIKYIFGLLVAINIFGVCYFSTYKNFRIIQELPRTEFEQLSSHNWYDQNRQNLRNDISKYTVTLAESTTTSPARRQISDTEEVEIVIPAEELKVEQLTKKVQEQEQAIAFLKDKLSKTQASIVKSIQSKNAAQEQEDKNSSLSEDYQKLKNAYSTITNRFSGQNQTLHYIADVFTEINPFRKLGLGLYEPMPVEFDNYQPGVNYPPNSQVYGIKHNPSYCDAVDLYNLRNPQNLFGNMNFISDYGADESLTRQEVMRKIGIDVMKDVYLLESNHQGFKHDLAVNGTMIFMKRVFFHSIYKMNKETACLSQMYNHIPGSGVLTRKDLLAETVRNYTALYVDRPQCIKQDEFFPHTFRLDVKSECLQFFSVIRTKEYQANKKNEPIQYLLKLGYGAHRASGVFLFDEAFESHFRSLYKNGASCGTIDKPYVAQKYVSNPLLLDKQNKFDFRIYMLVASVNPLIVYYHDGFLRVSLSTYDKNSTEKNVHFTNTHLSKEIFQKAKQDSNYEGMTEDELRDYQMWTMEDLERYLIETGKVTDKNWLDNYLRPKFKEAFVHISRMAEESFYKSSSVFEMYGLDFVMDENLNIFLIECNASPQLIGTNQKKTDFLTNMLKDLFEIEYAYLRSRMMRVHKFVKEMEIKTLLGETLDYSSLRKEFDQINMNKLEPEFPISENSTFIKIVDKNLPPQSAFFGHIEEQCI